MSDFIGFIDLPVLFIKPVSTLFIRIKEFKQNNFDFIPKHIYSSVHAVYAYLCRHCS